MKPSAKCTLRIVAGAATALASGGGFAQTAPAPAPTAAELEQRLTTVRQQEAALEEQLRAARIREAQAAIAAEEAARARAAEARAYLASVNVPVQGSQTTAANNNDATNNNLDEAQNNAREESEDSQKFGGIEFGVGIAFSYDLGDNDRIAEAELVNGIVRVTRRNNVRARLILESHYFFTPTVGTLPIFGLQNTRERATWGWGPFIALQPGSDTVIEAIGAGLMVGLRRPGEGNDSFNLGMGVLYDIDARILGEGIVANEELPEGETAIRYEQREQSGLLIVSSYSF